MCVPPPPPSPPPSACEKKSSYCVFVFGFLGVAVCWLDAGAASSEQPSPGPRKQKKCVHAAMFMFMYAVFRLKVFGEQNNVNVLRGPRSPRPRARAGPRRRRRYAACLILFACGGKKCFFFFFFFFAIKFKFACDANLAGWRPAAGGHWPLMEGGGLF